MLETNSERAFAVVIIGIALLLLYLFVNMPQPTAKGYCVSDCTEHFAYTDSPYMDSDVLCGTGCDIDKIEYNQDIAHPGEFEVTCICCECVGSESLELPECEGPFGFIFRILGRCK